MSTGVTQTLSLCAASIGYDRGLSKVTFHLMKCASLITAAVICACFVTGAVVKEIRRVTSLSRPTTPLSVDEVIVTLATLHSSLFGVQPILSRYGCVGELRSSPMTSPRQSAAA